MIRAGMCARAAGQSIVLVTLALVLLVAMAGLGIDGANAFNQRRNLQNAADAASVAGASALIAEQRVSPLAGDGAANVRAAVANYLSDHGVDPNSAQTTWTAYYVQLDGTRIGPVGSAGQINSSARGVSIDVQQTFSTWFMQMLGRSTLTVGSAATAVFGPHKLLGGDLLPLTISQHDADAMALNSGAGYIFGETTGAYKVEPGNFGSLSLNPSKTPNQTGNLADCTNPGNPPPNNLSYWWCNGTAEEIEIGDYLYGDTGQLSNSLADAIQWRIDHRPLGLAAIYDATTLNGGNTQFRVVGFILLELISQDLQGGNKTITARFKGLQVSTGAIDPNAPVIGSYAINLIKTPTTLQ